MSLLNDERSFTLSYLKT